MAINYPPFIDEVLPAFYGNTLTVPFIMNQAVGFDDIKGFHLKIKTLQGNIIKYDESFEYELNNNNISVDKSNFIISFVLPSSEDNGETKLKYPNSYKVQIGYIFKDNQTGQNYTGLLSNVGIAKYTTPPSVFIKVLNNNGIITLTGTYRTEDVSEKLYSSYFIIKDSNGDIFYQSKEKIHNSFNDDEIIENEKKYYIAYENTVINKKFQPGAVYTAQFFIKTLNNIQIKTELSSFTYPILNLTSPEEIILTSSLNYNDAFVEIKLTPNSNIEKLLNCKLVRLDSKDNFSSWVELLDNFNLDGFSSQVKLFRDFSIEHGVVYQYQIIYDNGEGAKYKSSEKIEIDFEDIFLYDGEKQFKIRFNPKISGFKNNIVETKINTIGSKYPYIFRNGYINYKEFSLSGTISLLMDELGLFYNIYNDNTNNKTLYGVDLTKDNIYNEKNFRDNILEWLTNGKPKLFKSPTEGNYLVQLMNVSLSPLSDSINRMIYNFSSSVYEIEECNIDNLLKNNFIKINPNINS